MLTALRRHWPEYLIEAAGLGIFMIVACLATALLELPASPVRQALADPVLRRALVGSAMGLTAIALTYSPWGKQSGAHFNPTLTLTFFRLGKVAPADAVFYVLAQFVGGLVGVLVAVAVLGEGIMDPAVGYVVTIPGAPGVGVAFLAEALISFGLMVVVLAVSNTPRLARFTGLCAGCLVLTYITLEAPLSGMSMNPVRTLGSAIAAQVWTALWVYFTAPPLGMGLAAELYSRLKGPNAIRCAKLHHDNDRRCIFRCG
jgi:aquaporin Z